MKRITLIYIFLLLMVSFISTCFAGLDEGLVAFKKRDFETALCELKPLAEQSNRLRIPQ